MPSLNLYSDLTAIANNIQEDAYFAVREGGTMQRLIKVFQDLVRWKSARGLLLQQQHCCRD